VLTKASAELTLFDILSRLTFAKAVKRLAVEGSRLIMASGKHDIDIARLNLIGRSSALP
jgi:hypothetical protein